MNDLKMTIAWVTAQHETAHQRMLGTRRDERGASAVEWLLIIIAAVGICAAVAVAVTMYVDTQAGKLNS